MPMSITDQLIHTTVRIECQHSNGSGMSGTGFLFRFEDKESAFQVPAIITNKHVISGASVGTFSMTLKSDNDEPLYGQHISIPIGEFESHWVKHPRSDVDLAAFPIAPVLNWLKEQNKSVFYISVSNDLVADKAFVEELNAVEDILMIGYPNGIWDAHNNIPIIRRGITATPPFLDFENRPEFMIDCACFPGSSGSPVFLYNMGGHMTKNGSLMLGGSRIKLLGILWGGPQYTVGGTIKAVPVPAIMQPMSFSQIPNNLGFCVKADQLLWFQEHFGAIMEAQKGVEDRGKVEPSS
jgi:hypothetical protein